MWREPVPQLTRIRRQIQRHLPHLIHHHPPRTLISAESMPCALQLLTLANACHDGPHEEVGDVDGYWLGEAGEFGGIRANDAGVAGGVEWKYFEAANALFKAISRCPVAEGLE